MIRTVLCMTHLSVVHTDVLDLERSLYVPKAFLCLRIVSGALSAIRELSQFAVPRALERSRVAVLRPYCTLIARLSSSGRCKSSAASSFSTSSRSILTGFEIGSDCDTSG